MDERKQKWLDRYAKWIAAFSALLLIVSFVIVGYILFVVLTDSSSKFSYSSILFVLVVISLPLLLLMMYFSQKTQNSQPSDESADYVISCWSIETLRAAGVPRDLTKCLKDIYDNAEKSSPPIELSIKNSLDDSPNSWLIKLKENLGEIRVNEFSEIILKYTRRDM